MKGGKRKGKIELQSCTDRSEILWGFPRLEKHSKTHA